MRGKEVTFLTVSLVLAVILGGFLGELVGSFLPQGAVKTLFERNVQFGFEQLSVDIYAICFTIGLLFKFNFVSLLAVIFVIVYFRYWYF